LCSKSEIALLTDMVKQTIRLISVSNVAPIRFVCFAVFLLRLFNFCLLYLFSATLRGGEIKLYILAYKNLLPGHKIHAQTDRYAHSGLIAVAGPLKTASKGETKVQTWISQLGELEDTCALKWNVSKRVLGNV